MTAKVVPVSTGLHNPYGLYQRSASLAFVIALALHCLAIASYWLLAGLVKEEEPLGSVIRIPIRNLLPPSIFETESPVQTGVLSNVAGPTNAVPVPVPDAEVNPEQDFPTQKRLSKEPSPGMGNGSGSVVVMPPESTAEQEPEPIGFTAVEKPPVPVRIVQPEYPDLAKRAGVEGMVVVRALVDKEGKVKRAIVITKDTDFFNDVAVAAARQWVFTPAMMNSGPVMVWVSIPFRFRLNK